MGHEAENHRSGDDARGIGRNGSRGAEGKNELRAEISGTTNAERRANSSHPGAHGQGTARSRLVAKVSVCECAALRPGLVMDALRHRKTADGLVAWYSGSRKKFRCPGAWVSRPGNTDQSR